MIIDSHQHFWKYNSVRDAWIDSTMEVIRKDFLPKDLKPILEENGVDGCIAVQALPNTPPGTKWILMDKIYDLNKNE